MCKTRYNIYNIKSVKLSNSARHSYERLCGVGDKIKRGKRATWRSAVLKRPRMDTDIYIYTYLCGHHHKLQI